MADKIRVLYVDDESVLLDICKLYLERTGMFNINTLTSATEALLKMDTERYDVIISDYQMPEMDGITFLKQLKASGNTTPFIIFTGRGREEVAIEALNSGADFYIQKGGDPKSQFAELSNKIRYAVSKKQSEEALKESEERYRSVVDDQREMIARFTPDGNITFVNKAYRLYFESLLDLQKVEGKNIRDILQVKNYAGVEKFLSSITQKNPTREIERVIKGTDGNLHWQVWSVRALFGTNGNPAEYQVVGRDITDIITQKNTERELQRNEQRSLAVILNADSLIWEVDTEGVYRYSTPAVEQILGYSPDELVGKMHFYDLFEPSVKEELKEVAFAAMGRREPFRHFVNLNCHRNGTLVVLNTSGTPVFEEDGTFSGYCGIDEDITERKATESAFQAIVRSMVGSTGLNSLQKITENVSSWLGAECVMVGEIQSDNQTVKVLSMLLDGKVVNDFTYTLKGTPCDNVAERGFCLYPDNIIELFPESKDLVELNIRGYIGTPLRDSSGQVCGILCALFRKPIQASPSMQEIMDIIAVKASAEIERTQIEHAFKENRQMLAEAMDLANMVNWEFDVRTGMFTFNDRFYTLYGTTVEIEGGNQMPADEYAKRFLHPEDQDLVIKEVDKALEATDPGYTSRVGHRIIRRDGEIRHIIVRFGITKDENGRTIKTHGANQDITELMRVEDALKMANKKLNILSSITRHDINNQLAVLVGYLRILEKKQPDPTLNVYSQKVASAAERISAMIRFTKEYELVGIKAPTWQDCRTLVDTVAKDVPLGHVIVKNALTDNIEVFADPLIVKVFYNMMDNAVRYGGKITTIRFALKEHHGCHVIVCEDDGNGVFSEEKERIFDWGVGKNTGLGLALSREILDITGISICETGEPGKGARFEMTVPKGAWRTVDVGRKVNLQ